MVGFNGGGEPLELGSTLENVLGFTCRRPVTLVSVSDWNDWKAQAETFYRLRPGWGRGKAGDPNGKYYRVRFDDFDVAPVMTVSGTNLPARSDETLTIPSFSGYAAPLGDLRGVSFWPRTLARFIDIALHYLAGLVAGVFFVLLLVIARMKPPIGVLHRLSQNDLASFAAGLLGFFAYQVVCTSVSGRTLGKLLLSMQVVQDDGSCCGVKSAVVRELGYFVDAMFFGVIGYFAMRDDPEQKRHGDDWARTMVVRRSDVPRNAQPGSMRIVLGLMLGIFVDVAALAVGMLLRMSFYTAG